MKRVEITRLAQREIDAQAAWLERRRAGLGIEFYERVDEAVDKIERNPQGFQTIFKDMRRVTLEQFQEWGLFFRIRDDGSVVIACMSGKRHPSLKHERAAGVIPIRPEP